MQLHGIQKLSSSGSVHFLALGLWITSGALFHVPLYGLAALAVEDYRFSHTLLAPLIAGFLLWLRRQELERDARLSPALGLPVVAVGLLMAGSGGPAVISGIAVLWAGLFALLYGPQAVRQSVFPLAMLAAMIPLPVWFMESVSEVLQHASAGAAAWMLRAAGEDFVQAGTRFELATAIVDVTQDCSGIRSAVVTLLGASVAGQLFLNTSLSRVLFVALCVPVVIFKNAARIAAISWLGVHVDQGYFYGDLHQYAGMPFALLSAGVLIPALWVLRRAGE